jgi:hypothetical protein
MHKSRSTYFTSSHQKSLITLIASRHFNCIFVSCATHEPRVQLNRSSKATRAHERKRHIIGTAQKSVRERHRRTISMPTSRCLICWLMRRANGTTALLSNSPRETSDERNAICALQRREERRTIVAHAIDSTRFHLELAESIDRSSSGTAVLRFQCDARVNVFVPLIVSS